MKERITVSLSRELVEKLHRKRGLAKMSTYVEALLRKAIEEEAPGSSRPMAK